MAFNLFTSVQAYLARTDIDQNSTMPDVPAAVRSFLGRLGLLQGVPLYNIIPSEKYLPRTTADVMINNVHEPVDKGALKFFWLNKEWIECLLDGALSIGPADGHDLLLAKAMAGNYAAEALYNDAKDTISKQIAGLYSPADFTAQLSSRLAKNNVQLSNGQPAPTVAQNNWCYTGFFLRSAIIANWTGVEIIAQGSDPATGATNIASAVRPLQVVRFDRLAADTIFCMCEGIVSMVEITQPSEAIHFAVSEANGAFLDGSGKYPVTSRATPGVLNITDLAAKMAAATAQKFAAGMIAKPLKVQITISWPLQTHQ